MSNIKETKIIYTNVFERNIECNSEVIVNVGGARSSKSYSLAQLIIFLFYQGHKLNFGITRKTMPALKMTAYKVIIDLLKEYNLYNAYHHNKTLNYYENSINGSRIQFFSIDEPNRIKSTEFNYIWLEEANEFTYRDFMLLWTRLSGKNYSERPNQIFLSLNPDEPLSWIKQRVIPNKKTTLINSTYKDNPFISKSYIDILKSFKEKDPTYYKIYAKGEWGNFQSRIYTKYTFINELPKNPDEIIYGLDFGYNVQSALVEIYIKDGIPYIKEIFYLKGLLNSDIIEKLKEIIPEKNRDREIFCDCAEADRIQEICDADFNALPADKNVLKGIDTVKKMGLNICKDSKSVIKEVQTYKWKKNKNDETLDEPVKEKDHLMDAIRYALHTRFKDSAETDEKIFSNMGL